MVYRIHIERDKMFSLKDKEYMPSENKAAVVQQPTDHRVK